MAARSRVKKVKVKFHGPGVDFRVIEVPASSGSERIVKLIWCAANDFTLEIPADSSLIEELWRDPDFEVMG